MQFTVRGIPQEVADEVRRTRPSPGYGHPAHLELARGTGPCRCCLAPFVPGRDGGCCSPGGRAAMRASLMAPGPVFIHAGHCAAFAGEDFPMRCAFCRWPSKRAAGKPRRRVVRAADVSAPKSRWACCSPSRRRTGCTCVMPKPDVSSRASTGCGRLSYLPYASHPRLPAGATVGCRSKEKAPAVSRGGPVTLQISSRSAGSRIASVAAVAPPRLVAPKSLLLIRQQAGVRVRPGNSRTAAPPGRRSACRSARRPARPR